MQGCLGGGHSRALAGMAIPPYNNNGMSKVHTAWNYLCKYKYLFVILFASLLIGVLDENSVLSRSRRKERIAELRREIADYEQRFDAATSLLHKLDYEPGMLERVAREKYYMKRSDEEVFVIKVTGDNATTEAGTQDTDTIKP